METIRRGPQDTEFARDYTVNTCVRKDRSECEFCAAITSETLPRRVAMRWKACSDAGNRLAVNVLPGEWVLFEVPHDPTEDIWLGRSVSNPEWRMSCTRVHEGKSRKVMCVEM